MYDFELDMTTKNSNSVIINNIGPGSRVLEVGCAHGRMTKFLKEQLGCKVDIIEKSRPAAKSARPYSEKAFMGAQYGDIERRSWMLRLERDARWSKTPIAYDYIVFADVLEHLFNPALALERTSRFLAPYGKIWISVPNISHNAVLIDLLQDKFEYRDVGLLDKTHVKFFTEQSLETMIEGCGLKVYKKENLLNDVSHTEFNNSYNQLPNAVSDYLKRRNNGEVYQFVWGLQKK